MNVLTCLQEDHDLWLVCLATAVCLVGAGVTIGLWRRVLEVHGFRRLGWLLLSSITAGSVTWCTHFIAMLAYQPGAPVSIDPVLTMSSFLIVVAGAFTALLVASGRRIPFQAPAGGVLLGLAVAAMHYTGMMAYRIDGILRWDTAGIVWSILLACAFGAGTATSAVRGRTRLAMLLLVATIVSLHFTAMGAITVEPLHLVASGLGDDVFRVLAVAVAGSGFLVAGVGAIGFLIDVENRNESLERLRAMAMNDALTGLPNRVSFAGRIERELAAAADEMSEVAVVGIDLDRFKEINDLRGHAAGDAALCLIAARLQAAIRPGECVARVGGDEFGALARSERQDDITDFVWRLEAALGQPLEIDGMTFRGGASLGVAVYPTDGRTADRLVANADLAMYRAKIDPRSSVCFYEDRMGETAREQRALSSDLRLALERGEFELHYQVQQSMRTGLTAGYEVLLRWRHPLRGLVPPLSFIPVAEETGDIVAIGEWVLREACREAAGWTTPHKIAVNISPVQFSRADLAETLRTILVQTGLSPARLELEVTESTIIADKASALRAMRMMKALGVSIALDDFGTGYSSFETLRAFPFDKIKLDRSFITEIGHSVQAKAIVRAVITLGRTLDIAVLAEGVETKDQLGILREEGCDEAQGFHLGRPAPYSVASQPAPPAPGDDLRLTA